MVDRFSFELLLLERMSKEYRASVLRQIGLASADAARIRASCPLLAPWQLGNDLTTYLNILGAEVPRHHVGYWSSEELAGSRPHCFLLALWPHLFWVLHEDQDGSWSEVGFRNQTLLNFQHLDPATVRVGLWTRAALRRLADGHALHDGWNEQVTERFTFGSQRYEGQFVYGLLQEWSRIE